MQTSGQFGVPPEVPSHYNPVTNTMTNNNSNTSSRSTSTAGSNQALGHMLFNFSTPPPPHDPHAPLSSPAAPPPPQQPPPSHSQPAAALPPVLLSKAGTRDGGTAELLQESKSVPSQQVPPPPQQQQNPQFSHFLQSTAAALEHFQPTDNAHQDQIVQGKQGNTGSGHPQAAVVQVGDQQVAPHSMQVQQKQLNLGVDQAYNEGGMNAKGGHAEIQQMSADPISMGDIDQAEEGAGAGGRWPRQETLALLKIRADMDASFRDTSVKRPLWDEVSRKMGELGYERSAKKCKEKFENVNKYYKRTKEGKVGRQDGKHYRFFTQLEALSTNNNNSIITNTPPPPPPLNPNPLPLNSLSPTTMLISNSISSTIDTITKFKASASDSSPLLPGATPPALPPAVDPNPPLLFPFPISASAPPPFAHLIDPSFRPPAPPSALAPLPLSSPSSGDDDATGDDDDDDDDEEEVDVDDDVEDVDDIADDDYDHPQPRSANPAPLDPSPTQNKKRKRKASSSMMAFFEGLLKKVIDKQEQMQQKFLQALERRETDRMIREEAWRRQEMARLSKEHELRAQERSSAAARDAALMSFLQKFTGQTVDLPTTSSMSVPIAAQPVQCAPPLHQESMTLQQYEDQDPLDPNSRRWLKPEVLALIDLHSSLQAKFTEAGPKGHLWEEIANGMAKLGYVSRNAKRCKEKWENINKYFKRAKESNKKRPDNAKTCPYFHELDALYRKRVLGSSNANQHPYKPSIEYAQPQTDDDSVVHQPSSTSITNGEGIDGMDLDCARNLQAQPPAISSGPTDQALDGVTGASMTGNVSIAGGSGGGDGNTPIAGTHTSDNNVRSSARTGGFTAELGLNSLQQSENQLGQSGSKESKPAAILAPLPNSASFMSSMMQKINSSSAAVSNNNTIN